MPSLNPKASFSVGNAWQSRRQMALTPDSSSYAFPSAREYALEPRRVGRERAERDMDVRGPERLFPVFGGALADIAQFCRARGHALLERQREAVERVLRNAQRLEALEGERGADPSLVAGIRRARGGGERRNQPP